MENKEKDKLQEHPVPAEPIVEYICLNCRSTVILDNKFVIRCNECFERILKKKMPKQDDDSSNQNVYLAR
jgi:DNA-directed RNA polymerase subunit RPC12/RpoP